jgi:hypothetical protein
MAAAPACAQSFSGFLRGLSNSLSGGSTQPAPAQNTSATATIGVRGMDDGSTANAGPARPEELKLLDSWSASQVEAEIAAGKRGLVANKTASYGAAPTTAAAPAEEIAQ